MTGRLSPPATAMLAKLCRMSWNRMAMRRALPMRFYCLRPAIGTTLSEGGVMTDCSFCAQVSKARRFSGR